MFNIGDVVFARLEGYPEWPAKLIQPSADHLFKLNMGEIPPDQRLVLFYNDNGQYAVMHVSELRPIDDPRLQRRTREYKGQFRKRLLVAFKSALDDHPLAVPEKTNPSPPPASPKPSHRSRKPTLSHLTSPITGHSDSRQSSHSQHAHTSHKPAQSTPPHTSPSSHQPSAKQNSHPQPSNSPTMTSRTHPDTSVPAPPPKSGQPANPSPSVKLRLRRKRSCSSSHDLLQSPHSNSSPPPPVQPVTPLAPKRRRSSAKNDTYHTNQSQTEDSNGNEHKLPTHNQTPASGNEPHSTKKRHDGTTTTRKITNTNSETPVTTKRNRIARSTSQQHGHRAVLADRHAPASTDEDVPQRNEENGTDKTHQIEKQKPSPRVKGVQPSDGEDQAIANRSSSPKRQRLSNNVKSSGTRGTTVRASDVGKKRGKNVKRKAEQAQIPSKRRKADLRYKRESEMFAELSKSQCIEAIKRMIYKIRCNHVKVWQLGYKGAEAASIVKTDKEMWSRCELVFQKTEELLRITKTEDCDEQKVETMELEAFRAIERVKEVYFDLGTVSLQKVGKRLMSLGLELRSQCPKVWSAMQELLVLWADLTTEDVQEVEKHDERTDLQNAKNDCGDDTSVGDKENESNGLRTRGQAFTSARQITTEASKGSLKEQSTCEGEKEKSKERKELAKKEFSAREERMMKFDRKSLLGALEAFVDKLPEDLGVDGREKKRFTRKVEKEIRPRFEEDRAGYYKASVKVIRGLRKALKEFRANAKDEVDEKAGGRTCDLVDALRDESAKKTKQLVARLLG